MVTALQSIRPARRSRCEQLPAPHWLSLGLTPSLGKIVGAGGMRGSDRLDLWVSPTGIVGTVRWAWGWSPGEKTELSLPPEWSRCLAAETAATWGRVAESSQLFLFPTFFSITFPPIKLCVP